MLKLCLVGFYRPQILHLKYRLPRVPYHKPRQQMLKSSNVFWIEIKIWELLFVIR